MFTSNNNNRHFLAVFVFLVSLIIISCGGGGGNGTGPDPEPEPEPEPEPTGYTYIQQEIFNQSCALSGCHDSGTQESGVNLSSHDAALNSVGAQYGEEIINPGSPDDSPLVDKIEANPEIPVRMPKDRPPLADADIDSIRAWIEDGAPNN